MGVNVENEHIVKIKHDCRVLIEIATHSKSMSIGAKQVITNKCKNIMKELEVIELQLMAK